MNTSHEEQERLRLYLLGELEGADEEAVELRLLSDAGFAEELEIVEEDLIDGYAADALAPDERRRLERRFFDAPERRRRLRFALALKARGAEQPRGKKKAEVVPLDAGRRRALFRTLPAYLKVAAGLLLALGVGYGVWSLRGGRSDVEQGIAALREAYKHQRVIEPRVTAVDYAPLVVTRGREQANVDALARARAERLLLDAVSAQPDAQSHHALGRFYLLDAQFGKAVEQFEKALRLAPNDAQAHSDLGAALLEVGRQEEQGRNEGKALEVFGQSLEHVNRAAQLDPDLLEALFNRALVLEHQGVPEQAKDAWRQYLARDPQSKWAEEAKRRLNLLSERSAAPTTAPQLLADFMSAARERDDERAWPLLSRNREMITGKFLPQQLASNYLNKSFDGATGEADEFLHALAYAGKLERERARDPYVADVAAFYAHASAQQRALLREAQANVFAGYDLCLQAKFEEALKKFSAAKTLFERAGDAWEGRLCDYWVAYCYSQLDRLGESTALLSSLADYCRRSEYKWLLGQATCWIATNYAELGDHSQSIRFYERALEVVEPIGDAYNTEKVLSQLASQYNHLGQPRRALEYNWRSLRVSERGGSSVRQLWRNYLYTARTYINLKLYDAAAAFGGEMLHLALNDIKAPDVIHYSYHYLGQIYGGLRRYDEAVRLTTESVQIARSLKDERAARKQGAYSVLQIAHLQRQAGRCEEALSSYDQAIEVYDRMELSIYKYDAHKGRLLCHVALGRDAEIEAGLPVVLEKFDEYRRKIPEEQNLNTFVDREQGVYDIAINHAYAKGDARRAFAYSEGSRARALLDTLRKTSHETGHDAAHELDAPAVPLGLAEIQARMPADVQAVQYAVLEDKTLIWLVTRDSFNVARSDITAEDLEAKISAYVNAIARGPAGVRDDASNLAAELYAALVAPVAHLLDSRKVVCVIPDKAVSRLPFAALRSTSSGRYLVAEFTLLSSPSLNVFLHCSEASRDKRVAGAETLLSVGNPSFDSADFPSLPSLPAAAREARGIAKFYSPAAREFVGAAAVREEIERELPNADVIHFAGHYLPHARDPLASKLVLAKRRGDDDAGDGSLSARDLVGRRLTRARLVVLSACQTGGEGYFNGEGLIGISRTFLGTGTPLVVASQWAVDSEATAEMMLRFHRHRKADGLPAAAALRRAQLDLLEDPAGLYRDPYYWAAFLPVGGHADF